MENLIENVKKGQALGASLGLSAFLASCEKPTELYRVNYGYINDDRSTIDENDVNTLTFGVKTIECETYGEALDAYNGLRWLRERDNVGRRFIEIEIVDRETGKWNGTLFHDCQHR